jgi:hypothetical protein
MCYVNCAPKVRGSRGQVNAVNVFPAGLQVCSQGNYCVKINPLYCY